MAEVHRAGLDDEAALLGLIREFYVVDQHDYDERRVSTALRPLLEDDALGQVWLLAGPDGPVGYAIVTWTWSLESGGRDSILDELYVRTPGAGLGGALLEHAIAEAEAYGARALFLETEAPNARARRFYAEHGLMAEDSVWMSMPLPRDGSGPADGSRPAT
jgi:GNAT superfamily N-acetyltransferase